MKLFRGVISTFCALWLLVDQTAAQDNAVFTARQAAKDLNNATAQLKIATQARDRIAALTSAVKAYEKGLRAMRASLRAAAVRERTLRLQFTARRDQIARLLGVLQTLERASTPLLLIHPSGPLGTARSGQILSQVTPALQARAEEIKLELEELILLQALQTSARDDMVAGLQAVQNARVALTKSIDQRTDLPKRFVSDPVRLQIMVDNSTTLAGFANGLADLPFDSAPDESAGFAAGKGSIPLPVFGTLLRGFNEADAAGVRRPGIVLSAPPVSLVTTPWAATIRYRGPFLDYGNVIVLEPGAGYLMVIAGLGQVYGEVGDILIPGDPVGLLGGSEPASTDFLTVASQGSSAKRQETVYIEIRRDETSENPEEWFAFTDK